MREYPALNEDISRQLTSIEPSYGIYYPCKVTMNDGQNIDNVYLARSNQWYELWGVWPEEDKGKMAIDIADVCKIEESPSRLPPSFAQKLYTAGESGMGYTIFTVQFLDGTKSAFSTGNAIDFVDYPSGQSQNTVSDVLPHIGRNDAQLRPAPDYYWCLFS